jgi:hypothetical protein
MGPRIRKNRGVTLAEAIIASFVLTAAMAVSAALYHTALQYSVRIDRRHLAARAAERKVEEIRAWSRNNHGTNGSLEFNEGWDTFDGTDVDDPEFPGYKVHTEVEQVPLYSPSSEFEEIRFSALEDENIPDDLDEKRVLNDSSYLLTVTASWDTGPENRVVTRILVTDPVRDHGWSNENADQAIELTYSTGGGFGSSCPATLAVGQDFRLSAVVKDGHGQLVENPAVQWYVDPKSTGNGTIVTAPSHPDRARFINEVKVERTPGNPGSAVIVHTGGQVSIVARVRLGGVEAIHKSPAIGLAD